MKENGLIKKVRKRYKESFLGRKRRERSPLCAIAQNILLSYLILLLCQLIFILANQEMYTGNGWWLLLKGNIVFATPAVCYLNALYALIILFPLHIKEGKAMQCMAKWAFILPNAAGVIANLCDCIYVRYTGRRTTWDIFNEFSNDSNIGKVIGIEVMDNLWLLAVGILFILAIHKLYTPATKKLNERSLVKYYIGHTTLLVLIVTLMVIGIRGGAGKSVRPITLSNANTYVSTPGEAALVLNTPFSIIRTAGRKPFTPKNYFPACEIDSIYSPVKHYSNLTANRKNIVVLIVESFGKEYIGAYNPRPDGSLTPFLDSLIKQSKSYLHSYGNGKKSIDGMPSVLSSIPMFVTPFISSSASLNDVSSIAGELGQIGYNSAFFHGAPNGSMGFMAYAKACGFDRYYGMDEYKASPFYKGKDDFDGTWAIWDEAFLQYYAESMNSIEERYRTASGEMEVPVIFFSPQGEAPFEPGIDTAMIAQHIDIMPTVLEYVGYDRPFIAFGKSLISTPAKESFAVNYANETYRYYKGEHILLYNGESDTPVSLFNLHDDIMMKDNIVGNNNVQNDMTRELRAIIQQYMNCMTDDRLTIKNDTIKQ